MVSTHISFKFWTFTQIYKNPNKNRKTKTSFHFQFLFLIFPPTKQRFKVQKKKSKRKRKNLVERLGEPERGNGLWVFLSEGFGFGLVWDFLRFWERSRMPSFCILSMFSLILCSLNCSYPEFSFWTTFPSFSLVFRALFARAITVLLVSDYVWLSLSITLSLSEVRESSDRKE